MENRSKSQGQLKKKKDWIGANLKQAKCIQSSFWKWFWGIHGSSQVENGLWCQLHSPQGADSRQSTPKRSLVVHFYLPALLFHIDFTLESNVLFFPPDNNTAILLSTSSKTFSLWFLSQLPHLISFHMLPDLDDIFCICFFFLFPMLFSPSFTLSWICQWFSNWSFHVYCMSLKFEKQWRDYTSMPMACF